jgi:hypothetical protein
MAILQKLTPNQDLQSYYFQPSAIAALSATSPAGFTVSGCWREQFDWAVIEWNRDDVFEHPSMRPLPDGDLSGLTLSYQETRTNCIALDSTLFPTVDWPTLRIWAVSAAGVDPYNDPGGEQVFKVPLANYATPIASAYQPASAQITLSGTITAGDYVGFFFLDEHYSYLMLAGDTLENALTQLVAAVQIVNPDPAANSVMSATLTGTTITLTFSRPGQTQPTGANGNRIGLYTYVSGAGTEQWDCAFRQFSGGTSPTTWQITLPFTSLTDPVLGPVPANAIRKLRWTYAADLQAGAFQRSEFQVAISNWSVTGSNRTYSVAGPGSIRTENTATNLTYSGTWTQSPPGNYSGGSIQETIVLGSAVSYAYNAAVEHNLYLGTRLLAGGATISVSLDLAPARTIKTNLAGEDVLVRIPLGQLSPGPHVVTATHQDVGGASFYVDFFELAIPTTELPAFNPESKLALATDWDTLHSIALAPERTAWLIDSLGFDGRVNHYVGATAFYELVCAGQEYASATVAFEGTPDANATTTITIATTSDPSDQTAITHLNVMGDTGTTLALAFALLINSGYTAIWAAASGNQLTIWSRAMGAAGNTITLSASPPTADLTLVVSGATLTGGVDGNWYTDLTALPRINRAARDWHQSYFTALLGYGLEVTASFSMELQNGDPSASAGIAQRYPSQAAVVVSTPALQTNFSPESTVFWQQVYLDMATVQSTAGLVPYLQFGEVQWWYFPDDGSGMPFYDAYTTSTFQSQFGRAMSVIASGTVDPMTVPDEAAFLPALIGQFTDQISHFVLQTFPACRFEVLYPVDTNSGALDAVVNYPAASWTPQKLARLKTESFTYTNSRDLDLCETSINAAVEFGFSPAQRSHLVGIGDPSSPWLKEARIAEAAGIESVVLFALDQLCLIGYSLPLSRGLRRSVRMG